MSHKREKKLLNGYVCEICEYYSIDISLHSVNINQFLGIPNGEKNIKFLSSLSPFLGVGLGRNVKFLVLLQL